MGHMYLSRPPLSTRIRNVRFGGIRTCHDRKIKCRSQNPIEMGHCAMYLLILIPVKEIHDVGDDIMK